MKQGFEQAYHADICNIDQINSKWLVDFAARSLLQKARGK
jgi:hypothetical protein